ncbi:MAG: hypothetical protein VZQ55_09600, partial [Ruminococcus sp.]|nr:hypothetical protein [Ruminococcus sp.]
SRAKNALAVLLTFAQRCCSLNPPQAAVATLPDRINKVIAIMIQSGYNSLELLHCFCSTETIHSQLSTINYPLSTINYQLSTINYFDRREKNRVR